MRLNDVINEPNSSLNYIERYVNDGSPMGLTWKNTTSNNTCPRSEIESFALFKIPLNNHYVKYGEAVDTLSDDYIYLHPDMSEYCDECTFVSDFKVIPTASARTVRILSGKQTKGYLKLHYDGIIDRIHRDITDSYCQYSIAVNKILDTYFVKDKLNRDWGFYREPYAIMTKFPYSQNKQFGMIYREDKPMFNKEMNSIFPFFGLWSQDIYKPDDKSLLCQILLCNNDPINYVFDKIIEPLIRNYFSLIINIGLQPEWHGQNLLFGISSDLKDTVVIFRDLESVDIDISLREKLGLNIDFPISSRKLLREELYDYQMRHSYMYDYKIGEYIFSPIENLLKNSFFYSTVKFRDKIKEISEHYILKLPNNFYPDNCWYGYPKGTLINQTQTKRPYIKYLELKYRR